MTPRPSTSGRRAPHVAVLLALVVAQGACRLATPKGFHVDLAFATDGQDDPARARVDDLIVWPVQSRVEILRGAPAELLTTKLRAGLLGRRFSVLAAAIVAKRRADFGLAEAGARRALESLDADGVFVVEMLEWDEGGLLSLGKVRARARFRLIGRGGSVLWQGGVRCDARLLGQASPDLDLDERRRRAVERFAELLAAKLPLHEG